MRRYGSLSERWLAWRGRILSSPRFQKAAMRLPFTRPIAKHRGAAAFDIVAGFVYAQVLHACLELGILERAAIGADAGKLADTLDIPAPAMAMLLDAAEAIGLVERRGERIWLGQHGAALFRNPGVAEMVAHHTMFYADLADLVALLRRGGGGGALADFWAYARRDADTDVRQAGQYSALMAASQPAVAAAVLGAYPFARHRKLLDVGGGTGAFLMHAAKAFPKLQLALFDLPAVAEIARERLRAAGLATRAEVQGGSFFTDPVPTDADLVTLIRILHDHDDDRVLQLLCNLRRSVAPGTVVLVAEPMAGRGGAGRMAEAYFSMYLLAMGSGRPRTAAENARLLREAGFNSPRLVPTSNPLAAQIVVARA